jgi:5-methylcytosine-specific restriction enzyme subunit McrC
MEDITLPTHVTLADAETIPLTRLNQHLEPLLNLARIFLDNSTLQLAEGLHGAFVFVFDMNILYEAFVANFIRKHRDEILQQNLYDCDLLPQSRGASRFLARCFDRPMFRLRPDLAFRIKTEFPLLLDTKYKRLDATDARLGVRQADFYQMYAYAQRYHCPRVLLLYPQMADMPSSLHSRFNIEEENREICVETLDLRVDLSRYEGKQHLIDQFRTILGDGQ